MATQNNGLPPTNLSLHTKTHGQWPHTRANKIFKQINKLHSGDRPYSHEYWNTSHMSHIYLIKTTTLPLKKKKKYTNNFFYM